ncbi:T9SS type A sorting domain-containing protein, partial [Flavobacteriales bacterium]|nr:T9SS type A sorting domain-containing protein [Flavobacteriales bacterium]
CPGTYIVIITDSNGCQINDTIIINSLVSVNEKIDPKIKIFPNPARDVVTIILESDNSFTQIKFMNMLGQVEFLENFKNRNQLTLNTYSLSAGMYMVHLSGENGIPVLLPVLIE